MDIVYRMKPGSNDQETVVFAERDRAVRATQIRDAIEQSATWGQFKGALPEGEWESCFLAHFEDHEENPPADDEAFEADDIPGYAEGDYPEWLTQIQLDWFPKELIAKYGGDVGSTVLSGPVLDLPADKSELIAADLRALGHTVERTELKLD